MTLETFPCKINGCEGTSFVNKGAYAFLCKTHRAEKAQLRVHKQKPSSSLKETAIRLVEISERIDSSSTRFRESKNQLIIDAQEFVKLLDDLKEQAKEILTG